ncbi:MAG: adenylate/guanylate cyclase domain-containing protein [Planctomycetes bacterium]|nr:adenylate/guanylate cyclase domain-containing protein [Planctomycetota bacterium]
MTTRRLQQKNLTVMFTDISGFTRHTETISRDELMSRLETHNELLMPVIAHFEGKIIKTIGDSFLITFESPTNAVQCGLFMQHTLRGHNHGKPENDQIHIKVSINSGEVTVTDSDVFGDPVNVAAKIEKATNPDEIYFTEAVFLAMNKSEVPNSFVKSFRPKGAESMEIKLYKVVMDEADERYRKIVDGTRIDTDKIKTRVLELSNTAEKEVGRYRDALEALVHSQGKSSRTVLVAVIAAALILGIAIVVGFAVFSGPNEVNPEQETVRSARAFLQADRPNDARDLLLAHIQKHGTGKGIEEALAEVEGYELNDAARNCEKMLAEGRPDEALAQMKESLKQKEASGLPKQILERAQSYMDARKALEEGDTARTRKLAQLAAGSEALTTDLKLLVQRADAVETARAILADDKRKRIECNAAVEMLAGAFGERTDHPVALSLLPDALKVRLYWDARDRSLVEGRKLLDAYKARFITIRDWTRLEREVDMGGLWNYSSDPSLRRNWMSWYNEAWVDHFRRLETAGEQDVDFLFRFGMETHAICRSLWVITAGGQYQIAAALERKPELLQLHRAELLKFCRESLSLDLNQASIARKLIREQFFTEVRPDLVAGLAATHRSSSEENPAFTTRGTCFALLADRADLGDIKDVFAFARENFDIFLESDWQRLDSEGNPEPMVVSRDHVKRLWEQTMSLEDYRELRRLLEQHIEDVTAKTGRWGNTVYAPTQIRTMLDDLKAAQPLHTEATGG